MSVFKAKLTLGESWLRVFLLGLVLVMTGFKLHAATSFESDSAIVQSPRYQHILADLRCLVCQNQDLLNSQAALALDMKQRIYELMRDGQSDQEIKDYLAHRYGEYILFDPPMSFKNALLWWGPALFLSLGFGAVIFWARRRRDLV